MPSIRRAILPLALLAALSGCQAWHYRPLPGPGEQALPSPVRVNLRDGSSLVVWSPRVQGDSVVGLVGRTEADRARVAVALSQVQWMDRRGVDVVATAGVTVIATLSLLLGVVLFTFSTW